MSEQSLIDAESASRVGTVAATATGEVNRRDWQRWAAAVGDHIDVLLDGGIRRGSDVVKAVALGARAVMIGRASLWGLAANGQAGVENVLDIMRSGVESAVLGLGHSSIAQLSPDDIVIPEGFSRHLG